MPLPLQPAENFDKTIGKIPRRRQCFLVRIPAGTDLNQHGAGAKMLIKPRTLQKIGRISPGYFCAATF